MSDSIFLAAIIGPTYLVLGLSLLIYAERWEKIAKGWEKDHIVLFGPMMYCIVFGLAIITMHNLWEWSPYLIITITGWVAFLKGAIYLLIPGEAFKYLIRKVNSKNYYLRIGSLFTICGAWLSYLVYIA